MDIALTATIGRIASSDEVIVLFMAVAPSHNVMASSESFIDVGVGCDDGELICLSAGWNDGAFADNRGAGVGKVLP